MAGAVMDEDRVMEMFQKTAIETSDPRCDAINSAACLAARIFVQHSPKCADLSHAVRLLRQAMRSAQDAILLKGVV